MTAKAKLSSRLETALLTDGDMRASILNYGAITQGWWYKDVPLVLGFDDPTAYFADKSYMGAIVGRVANRIGGAKFDLDGVSFELSANEGENTLHGGVEGLSKQFWNLEQSEPNTAVLSYLSRDGESGFPGDVRFEVRVTIKSPRLIYTFAAHSDRPTPISLTQHNYYTLGSDEGVDGHKLTLASRRYLAIDDEGVPSGRLRSTKEGDLDFSTPKPIRHVPDGIDHYFCFAEDRDPRARVAVLTAPSGLSLSAYSDQYGAQVYSRASLAPPLSGSAGVCIEPSGYPNAPNIPTFPSIVVEPDNPYRQMLALEVSEGRYES